MLCPVCKVELRMTDRQGIEVDYCPTCRGIWLDRGELDKLLERANRRSFDDVDDEATRPRSHDRDDRYDQRPKKRESWLGDLFDWD
jgi:Zn-finger nucleic acid-binding protein